MANLEVSDLHTSYGISHTLFGLTFEIGEAEVVTLMGRNGVGKTTTMRSIMGLTPPHRGRIRWVGKDITSEATYRVARLGIGYVPQERRIFPDLSVSENLRIARRTADVSTWDEQVVYEMFPDLASASDRIGASLSGGQQQMLAIGRSLMGNPKLLLLDEPSEGLAPMVIDSMQKQLAGLKQAGVSILLAEQNLEFALALSDRVHVLEGGEIRYSASADNLASDNSELKQYLTV